MTLFSQNFIYVNTMNITSEAIGITNKVKKFQFDNVRELMI